MVNLYNLYEADYEARCKMEAEYRKVIKNSKSLKIENNSLKNKLEM